MLSISQILLIIFIVMALSFGQLLFKIAADETSFSINGLLTSLFNFKLFIAVIVYFFATIAWLFVLKQLPLRVAYPYAGLAFVFVPLLAYIILGEQVYANSIIGALLILAGVWISGLK